MIMETEINIAEILKDKPKGTELYSPIFGKSKFKGIAANNSKIIVGDARDFEYYFHQTGQYISSGERLLFPSEKMRDWSKFAWKKGDVLVSNDYGTEVIFDKWYDNDYISFYGKHYLNSENANNIRYWNSFICTTENYSLEDKNAAQTYINTIEERWDGKLNLETLQIEKPQLEFRDGDIIVTDAISSLCYSKCIFILKGDLNTNEKQANSYVFYNVENNYVDFNILDTHIRDRSLRLATDEEKKKLSRVLARKGKAWDIEKKTVVDLKPKVEFEPFDRVITRDADGDIWTANIFSHINSHGDYVTIGCAYGYTYCLPYNEETVKLIGTTKDVEE